VQSPIRVAAKSKEEPVQPHRFFLVELVGIERTTPCCKCADSAEIGGSNVIACLGVRLERWSVAANLCNVAPSDISDAARELRDHHESRFGSSWAYLGAIESSTALWTASS